MDTGLGLLMGLGCNATCYFSKRFKSGLPILVNTNGVVGQIIKLHLHDPLARNKLQLNPSQCLIVIIVVDTEKFGGLQRLF